MKKCLMLIGIVFIASCGTLTEPHYYQDAETGKCYAANFARGDEDNSFRYIGVEWELILCEEMPKPSDKKRRKR